MKKFIIFSSIAIALAGSAIAYDYYGRRCTGSKDCGACKNCKYCKYCNEGGGTCGVCK